MAEKSCFGSSGFASSAAAAGSAASSVAGSATVRSDVLEGSVEEIWLGTAAGVETGPFPPAAMAAAAEAVVAFVSSSSQSISSSPACGALIVATVDNSRQYGDSLMLNHGLRVA